MNIILTGPKHCGKSTLISKIIKAFPGSVSGFITEFERRESDSRTLKLRNIDGSKSSLAVQWENGIYTINTEVFDIIAPEHITSESDLIIFDELGKFESGCKNLKQTVEKAFDSETNVIAVLRHDAPGWMGDLKNRTDITLITVNDENRDSLVSHLAKLISKQ